MRLLTAPWRLFTWLYEHHPKQTVAAILLLVTLSAVASGYANVALGQSNARNAVTNCENANESRAASRALWGYVIDLTSKNAPLERQAFFAHLRTYVNTVYQDHDCSRLGLKYPLPDPPKAPGAP